MINFLFLSFAFSAGLISFFSPCAVSLLPAYVAHFMTRHVGENSSSKKKLWKSITFSTFGILGFFTIFGGFGLLLSIFGQVIKRFVPRIAIVTGILLILLGFFALINKGRFFLRFPEIKINKKTEKVEAYLFGAAYAVAALGCTFPIFIAVILQGFTQSTLFIGTFPLVAYILGISSLFLTVTTIVVFSREWISKKINKVIPYILKIEGLILIAAGLYLIWYQSVLVGW